MPITCTTFTQANLKANALLLHAISCNMVGSGTLSLATSMMHTQLSQEARQVQSAQTSRQNSPREGG